MQNENNSNEGILISVVVPIYNESQNVAELHSRLTKVMQKLKNPYEIIFVDDGSYDGTFTILEDLCKDDEKLKVIKFSRNFGQHIAITAGLDCSRGDAVVLMDGDLQDPPEAIPELYKKFKEGYNIVYAVWKTKKAHFFKKSTSKIFYKIFKAFAKVNIPDNSGMFRIIGRQVVDNLKRCREKGRFITALMSWTGLSHAEVEIKREPRYAGKTKYNLFQLIKLAIHGVTAFSYFPLHIAIYVGFFAAFSGFVMGIYTLLKKLLFDFPILGYASILISIFFIGGIQLFVIGIIGEYIGRIYTEAQDRPLYITETKIGID